MHIIFRSNVARMTGMLFILLSLNALAQKDTAKVKLIQSDLLEYNQTINPDYQILTGNVIFEYDGSLLYCDIADIYIQKDLVVTKGNVHIIINDTTHMYGDSLRIDGDNDLAELMGNVKLIDNQVTLTTDHLFYDLKNDIAYYLTGGEINDPENYLTSIKGYYYQKSKDFYFSDSVYIKNAETEMFSDTLMYNTITEITHFYGKTKIIQPENTMMCERGNYDTKNDIGRFSQNVEMKSGSRILNTDSLFYDKSTGFSEAFQNIFFRDTIEKIMLNSHYGRFYETDSTFFATDSALMRIIDKSDTLFLHADSLFMINDTVIHMQKVLFAYNKARIWRHDFQAVSDSIVFLNTDSLMYLYNEPIMWLEETQLIADTIHITYNEGKMDRLFMRQDAFIVSQEKTKDFQQIKSKNMEGIFTDNELEKLWAYENAETFYYVFDDRMLLIGINKTTSEKVRISFIENQIDNIVFHNAPSGTMQPENELSESDKKLEGFRWEQSVRPKYPADVFRDPEIEPEAKELPVFTADSALTDSTFLPTDTSDIIHEESQIIESQNDSGRIKERVPSSDTTATENGRNTIKQPENTSIPESENIEEQQKKQKKECFLKRWIRNCKEKRFQKKSVSLQFH